MRLSAHRVLLSLCTLGILWSISVSTPFTPNGQLPIAPKVLFALEPGVEKRVVPTSDGVTIARPTDSQSRVLQVVIRPGNDDFPGVNIRPDGGAWDLSKYGHVEAHVINTSVTPLRIFLRVDNAGDWKDNPWNTESVQIEPGTGATITTIFGFSYGERPGYRLKPNAVVNLMLFTGKSDVKQTFSIESIYAAGPAGERPIPAPDDVRTKPMKGALVGPGIAFDVTKQSVSEGTEVSIVGPPGHPPVRVLFPRSPAPQSVLLKPPIGKWDLRDCLELKVRLRNEGLVPIIPRVRLESNGGISDWVSVATAIAPGAKTTMTIPFSGSAPAVMGQKGTGSQITSDAVSGVRIELENGDSNRVLYVDSIEADMPAPPALPDWLGKRPPATGDWIKTLDDEFDGAKVDASVWNVVGENYYDKVSHWSKDNVIVGGGVARLRYEKKTGFQNDDPTRLKSDYATGFLDTYDKWSQRYGYFEARMKLPTAPGLWPAFWMMPDRGDRSTGQGVRQDTANGGMEFDIMENLSRWGVTRYNIAMHYDGYQKDHKSLGSDKIYVQPDKDGFITCGLLWTPGSAIYYCNGQEVLRWVDPRISHVPSIIMFTLPSGGWDNSPLDDTLLPADFIIDYVRVWQRRDLASPADGKKPPASKTNG